MVKKETRRERRIETGCWRDVLLLHHHHHHLVKHNNNDEIGNAKIVKKTRTTRRRKRRRRRGGRRRKILSFFFSSVNLSTFSVWVFVMKNKKAYKQLWRWEKKSSTIDENLSLLSQSIILVLYILVLFCYLCWWRRKRQSSWHMFKILSVM